MVKGESTTERWREIQRASARRRYKARPRKLLTPEERAARKVACVKRWRENNPELYAAQLARKAARGAKPRVTPEAKARHVEHQVRRARMVKQQTPPWADREEILSVYTEAQKRGLTVDHVIPLKGRNVSGLHVPANLQLLAAAENSRKRNHHAG